jgi:hypothetical protein
MFSRNENEGIIRNVKLLKDVVDEIVVIDSSDPEKYKQLKNSLKSVNIKLFRTLPLGHLEPLFYYGINKTSSQYILKIDADEEPSRELIEKMNERNFLYNVYDVLWKDENGKLLGYKEALLFAKDSIKKITGTIHALPEFNEKSKKFSQEVFIVHHEKPTRSSVNKNYMEIESYERPMKVYLNYLKKRRGWFIGCPLSFTYSLSRPLNIYLTGFGLGCVRSMFDIILHGRYSYNRISFTIKYSINAIKFFDSLPKKEQKLRTEIAKEIEECGGIIKYLGLDKDCIVENLTKTFKWDIPGIEVFRKLILYRHFHKKPAYSFPY